MRNHKQEPERCFIDTNILLYAFIETDNSQKRLRAREIVQNPNAVISTQVVNETCVNLLKKTALQEQDIRELITGFYERYLVAEINRFTLLAASEIREKLRLSFWVSLVVASALCADCTVLYTEDLQHGLNIEEKLTVVNPFLEL